MKLVEVIRGLSTSEKPTEAIMELAGSLGKSPVKVEEAPGFVVNRILIPMINGSGPFSHPGRRRGRGGRYR